METELAIEPAIVRRKITVEEYEVMYEAGVFKPDERLELINGEILKVAPMNAPHISYVIRLSRIFTERLTKRAIVSTQLPIVINEESEPEPDLSILRWRSDDYFSAKPSAQDVYAIIEVASTSLVYDRRVKLPLYARAGVPEVWIVKVQERELEVYRTPKGEAYSESRALKPSDKIALLAFPDVEILLSEVFITPDA
jgi:Uma2 family endonuclease